VADIGEIFKVRVGYPEEVHKDKPFWYLDKVSYSYILPSKVKHPFERSAPRQAGIPGINTAKCTLTNAMKCFQNVILLTKS
jgi:hypothetical protein